MRFGWTDEEKEKYFIKAEQQIEAAGFTPFHRAGNTKKWWEAKRNMPNLRENEPPRNQFGKKEKTILIHGYMVMEMEECDK